MPNHDKHYVTAKAAIYSDDGKEVLLTRLPFKDYKQNGLPGGHIDAGETPDVAMVRELQEELGITVNTLVHRDFFVHENGKIVLGYVGRLARTTALTPSHPDRETGEWVTRQAFAETDIDAGYKKFVLDNWSQ